LYNAGGYPGLRGMMTWSVNWDAVNTCGSTYEYAANYQRIFGVTTSIDKNNDTEKTIDVYPNPASSHINIVFSDIIQTPQSIHVYNSIGEIVYSGSITNKFETISISDLPSGLYLLKINTRLFNFIKN
jgi:hypothetical protein